MPVSGEYMEYIAFIYIGLISFILFGMITSYMIGYAKGFRKSKEIDDEIIADLVKKKQDDK